MQQYKSLKEIFYKPNDPGSFASVNAVQESAKNQGVQTSKRQVEEFLTDKDAYTLHKQYRKKYERNPIIVGGIDKQWQADLADMTSLSKENDGYKFLLTVIDCFSKYAWTIPIKTKSSPSLLQAFKDLFKVSAPRKPMRLQTDKGKEFINKPG